MLRINRRTLPRIVLRNRLARDVQSLRIGTIFLLLKVSLITFRKDVAGKANPFRIRIPAE